MKPTYGYTKAGLPVHKHIWDHHPVSTAYQRFNKKVAILITVGVGNMTSFWVFNALSFCSLPAVLVGAHILAASIFPPWLITTSFITLIAWIAQTWLQLILLPGLMVGQQLQNEAADARASKQFEDTELLVDRLDLETKGGLEVIESHLRAQDQMLKDLGGTCDCRDKND